MIRTGIIALLLESIFVLSCHEKCVDYKLIPIDSNLIETLHNRLRDHIASGKAKVGFSPSSASNMNMLQWSDWLARMAQKWVSCCVQLNDKMQYDPEKSNLIGQNILTITTNHTPDEEILILHWYKQVKNIKESDVKNFTTVVNSHGKIGQYSQLMWAKTRQVGCAMASYSEITPEGIITGNKLFRFVCNYTPTGNVFGEPIYLINSSPCSKCPNGCDVVMKNLCKTDKLPITRSKGRPVAPKRKFAPVIGDSKSLPVIDQIYTWVTSFVRVTAEFNEGYNCTCLLRLPKEVQGEIET
ncbi:venom allergen 5 isoform X2 [Aethina tumida]|uniref:venom allergen 5 isoform X2 n=1 Tax=Aethina tumida TaxID=116153 RepID=UPI0021482231|nr:venom allergen 5 isoform X2 [Aethina tumida]